MTFVRNNRLPIKLQKVAFEVRLCAIYAAEQNVNVDWSDVNHTPSFTQITVLKRNPQLENLNSLQGFRTTCQTSLEPNINDLKKDCAINSYSITGMFKKDGNKEGLTFTRLTQAEIYLCVRWLLFFPA